MSMTFDQLWEFRLQQPEKFDRALMDVLAADDTGLVDPTFMGDEIWHWQHKRIAILKGPAAAAIVIEVWTKADLALSCMFGEPLRYGLEQVKRTLCLDPRKIERAYAKYWDAFHKRYSDEEIERRVHQWCLDAAERVITKSRGDWSSAIARLGAS